MENLGTPSNETLLLALLEISVNEGLLFGTVVGVLE